MKNSRNQRSATVGNYLARTRRYQKLSSDRERCLAQRIQAGSHEARQELVESNLGFVVKIASEYRNLGMLFEDLLNEGNVGLIEAANRFDGTKGTKFITYAIWWIRKSILRALSEQSRLIRVPGYHIRRAREIREAEAEMRQTLGRLPSRAEISARLHLKLDQVERILQNGQQETSLDAQVGDGELVVSDSLADRSVEGPESEMVRQEASQIVTETLESLNRDQRFVITKRIGFDESPQTLKQIGESMGLSRERVRQIELAAKRRLRLLFERRLRKRPDRS